MTDRQWLVSFVALLVILSLPAGAVMAFNYYIDPYWNFQQDHDLNDFQVGFDERQQKLNYLFSREPHYDSILIGTSRTTYMNTESFKSEEVFNLGLSALHIEEYVPYLQYAEKATGIAPDRIYVEIYLDSYNEDESLPLQHPEIYYEQATDHLSKITSLFSYDTYLKSKENYQFSEADDSPLPRTYTRDNQVRTTFEGANLEEARERNKEKNRNRPIPINYNESFKDYLQQIKNMYPDSEVLVFSDLERMDRLTDYLTIPSYFEAYERSVKEVIDVFGTYRSFYLENKYTTTDHYWFDYVHFYPEVGDVIINALEEDTGEGELFVDVTADNLETYIGMLRELTERSGDSR